MKILLDTHVIIWALTDDPNLSKKAKEEIYELEQFKMACQRSPSPDNILHIMDCNSYTEHILCQ